MLSRVVQRSKGVELMYTNTRIYVVIVSILLVVSPLAANAQQSQQGIAVGPGKLSPGLGLALSYDDNLLRSVPGTELDTFIYNITPSLSYEMQDNTRHFMANWDLDAGFHDSSSNDDYLDNTLSAQFELTPNSRTRLGISGEYKDAHDPRGTGRAEGLAIGRFQPYPDEWHHFKVEGNMAYGSEASRGRFDGDVGYLSKRYDNNRVLTAYRDRDDTYGNGNFYYQVAPKTSLVVGGGIIDHNYRTASLLGASLDSTDYQVSGGITWDALNKTTGTVRFGYINKDFTSAARASSNAFNWDVEVVWTPRTYSIVTLTTSRKYDETNGTGNLIQRDTYSAKWTHFWRDRLSSTVDFSYMNDSLKPTTREDDLINAGVQLNYDMRRWLTLSAGYHYDERDSNRNAFDYERNLFLISASITD